MADTINLRELLLFYADSGVDDALTDAPVDKFLPVEAPARPATSQASQEPAARMDRPSSKTAAPAPTPARPQTTVPDEGQSERARLLARETGSLDELRACLEQFDGCNLKFTAKSLVFGDGNPEADIMLVGEAPGRDEDIEGLPFVGRSGQLLDRMLTAIELDRTQAYITNVIPWRPPGNRTPTPIETEICRPFIERQIELVKPKVLVALGGPSSKILLGTSDGIMRLRGSWKEHETPAGVKIPTMPLLHPAYLLRNPAHKKLAWRDLLEIKARLHQLRGDLPSTA
ncbi:uracil-DNA glycosylase [Aliihoeflea aestuarii]|jgi:uracil-DNA glycosylase|uniref:uracil-DNA glycosylase n=1 Tax=Aliihoeflea aestuarii TaxID=453840 RepID=UPI002092768A|nr:uracil-DNA glycosylase [Aliihoeflea aestuarii]MCO6389480.1 uracil-DNA glycosylase [Aliihoeflea aestuarii]